MRIGNKNSLSSIIQLIILSNAFNFVISLPIILPTTAILLPNIGQYLSLIQILVLKLVIWTQIMRLLGLDYVGKGIKSTVPLSEQEDLDEILDYDDITVDDQLNALDRAESQTIKTVEAKPLLSVPIDHANRIENVFKTMQYSSHHDCLLRLMCEIGADVNHYYRPFGKRVKALFRYIGKPTPGSAEYSYHIAFGTNTSSELCANTFMRCVNYDANKMVNIAHNYMSSLFPNTSITV